MVWVKGLSPTVLCVGSGHCHWKTQDVTVYRSSDLTDRLCKPQSVRPLRRGICGGAVNPSRTTSLLSSVSGGGVSASRQVLGVLLQPSELQEPILRPRKPLLRQGRRMRHLIHSTRMFVDTSSGRRVLPFSESPERQLCVDLPLFQHCSISSSGFLQERVKNFF